MPWTTVVLIAFVVIAAALGGIITGNWLLGRRAAAVESARLDEYVGLGARTGLTGELDLQVIPRTLSVKSRQPATVQLVLTNKSAKPMVLNAWLNPAPASFQSNQIPFKVKITKNGRPVGYAGNAVLFPAHTKKDFLTLQPGQSKQIDFDLTRTVGDGKWQMFAPGVYAAEIWYETYLTGKYIGVHAWTGMTNHVVVRVTVTR